MAGLHVNDEKETNCFYKSNAIYYNIQNHNPDGYSKLEKEFQCKNCRKGDNSIHRRYSCRGCVKKTNKN